MKDALLLRAMAMATIGLCYFSYMGFSYLCSGSVPDGYVFGTIMLVMGALANVKLEGIVRKLKV